MNAAFAHLTLPTREVERTAAFLQETLGYTRDPVPANVPCETVWLNIGRGQQIHVFYVEGFEVSVFENEFGRHIALFHPRETFPEVRRQLERRGAEVFEPLRATPFKRFFFREPVNGYVFEVIERPEASPSA